jgi:hypothetical protein
MSIICETIIMPYISEDKELQEHSTVHRETADWRSSCRRLVTESLNKIASRVRTALDDSGLDIEVFFMIPSSGEALMTFATPVDPSEEDWARANKIICDVVENTIGIEGLRSRALPCVGVEHTDECSRCLSRRRWTYRDQRIEGYREYRPSLVTGCFPESHELCGWHRPYRPSNGSVRFGSARLIMPFVAHT